MRLRVWTVTNAHSIRFKVSVNGVYDVKDYMHTEVGAECPDPCALHAQNPCHYGFIFSGLELSGTVFLS